MEANASNQINQAGEVCRVELELGVAFIEDAFQLGVLLLDGVERVVDEATGGGDLVGGLLAVGDSNFRSGRELGAILQRLPPGERGDPEDVLLGVVVPFLQFQVDCLFVLRPDAPDSKSTGSRK